MSAALAANALDDEFRALQSEHENLLDFLYTCPIGVVKMNAEGDVELANPHAAQYLLALTREPTFDNFFVALESCAPELRHMVRAFKARSGVICEQHRIYVRASGPGVRVLACSLVKAGPASVVAILQNVTKQVEQERQLAQNDVLLDALLAGVNDFSLFSLDGAGLIETWNVAAVRLLGYAPVEVLGKPISLFYRANDALRGQMAEWLAAASREGWHVQDGWCERRDGARFTCQLMITVADPTAHPDAGYTVVLRDVTERRMTTDELRMLLTTDQMTGAFNRGRFFELARHHIQRCEQAGRPLSVVMFDVDHFKSINDNFGHAVGDEVLRRLVTCCKAQLGESGVLGRLGGEEFGVLLPGADLESARATAERLRVAAAADLVQVAGALTQTTVSLGCMAAKGPIGGIDDLLKAADKALYAAKRSGRNRVCAA